MKNLFILQKEAEELKDYLVNKYNLAPIKIKVKKINGGRAIFSSRFISIPYWAYFRGIHYFYWYVIHEVCHFICNDFSVRGHGEFFKNTEKEVLRDFGLSPVYSRAYVKQLLSDNGKVIYDRKDFCD